MTASLAAMFAVLGCRQMEIRFGDTAGWFARTTVPTCAQLDAKGFAPDSSLEQRGFRVVKSFG
jgi:hypothetical protein